MKGRQAYVSERQARPNVGIRVYGSGAIAVGLVGIAWGDFATNWQPVQALPFSLPYRTLLAYLVAICLLLGGVAIQWQRTARAGVLAVGIINLMFALCWLPRVIGFPKIFGTWGGFLEALCPVAAAAILYATLLPGDSRWATRTPQIARYLFGAALLAFGIEHFMYLPQTAGMVPKWIPPGQALWAHVTGVFHLMAGASILSGILDVIGSRLLTLMLIVFGALVWMPQLFAYPPDHTAWAGNAINLALIGAAWVIADWIKGHRKQLQFEGEPKTVVGARSVEA